MSHITDVFGADVFTDDVMRERLPKRIYKALSSTIAAGAGLDPSIADVVANAMKDWAVEKGATHYCHWFHPMTGATAEKHDSFLSPTGNGNVLIEFSGDKLIQGEPDASSFPSGGLRATFEARGYTAWDCTSPVFIKRDGGNTTLFIPCAFISYTGDVLDKKTPLLRSMEVLSNQAIRVMRLFGNTTATKVTATLGPEQEYFLVDRTLFEKRLDLQMTGRTLFGAPSPRGQELDDHYFGSLNNKVASFMADLNTALWRLGVTATTQHNEVAPAQYEIAPVFGTINVAADQNQLVMEMLEKTAEDHGMAVLLHEKPFAGLNGSGKHLNWSLGSDDGINLLNPGKTPHENAQFLVFMCAVVRAVDKYAKLLRASVANTGNDHRLGANEAPPAIISIFLGDQLSDILEQLKGGDGATSSKQGGEMTLGATSLPPLARDSGDRNRTSPFAFTGNRFEFRMCGSAISVSGPAFVMNTIAADVLKEIADELEGADDVEATAQTILKRIATDHNRIVFNGNGYSEEWVEEAAKRGLPNMRSTVEALEAVLDASTVEVFERHGVLTKAELHARYETLLEQYSHCLNIEAQTALQIASRQILPAVAKYAAKISSAEGALFDGMKAELATKGAALQEAITALQAAANAAAAAGCARKVAEAYRDVVFPAMQAVRAAADSLEGIVDKEFWPLPTYADLLFTK